MTVHPLHSSARTDWRTPEWLLELVRRVGVIALDPATSSSNPTRALAIYTQRPEMCGLRAEWPLVGLTFVNPPYGAHLDGEVDALHEVWRKVDGVRTLVGVGVGWAARIARHAGEWIAVVPNRTETAWWKRLRRASTLGCLPDRRIAFVNAETGEVGEQPNHGSTIFYHGQQPDRFVAAFREVGDFISGGKSGVGETRGGSMREIEGLRRRTIQRDMTAAARLERDVFLAKFKRKVSGFSKLEIQTAARFERELLAGTFAWSSSTRVMADDDKHEIFYLDKHDVELWRRPQTVKERNLELPLTKAG